jgi:hypothetical protein
LDYVRRLARIVGKDGNTPYDFAARSAALFQMRRVESLLKQKQTGNAETVAHTQHLLFTLEQALKTD